MKARYLLFFLTLCGQIYAAQQTISIGTVPNDKTGDPARTWAQKDNANFLDLYTQKGATFNVRDSTYGAVGDGVADDTAAIVAASTACTAAGRGVVLFPPGNYLISNTTTLGSNCWAIGYGATITPVALGSWVGGINHQAFVTAAGATNIVIAGFYFAYTASYVGGTHIITLGLLGTGSKMTVKDNISTYGGDFVANIGNTDVMITNNKAYNVSNACFDSWSGATNVSITNNFCTLLGTASRGIEFTGLTTALTAATTTNLIATGNTIYLQSAAQQGINVDGLTPGCAGNAAEKYGTIADNHIFMAAGLQGYGILLRFCATYWDVHDNQIYSDGTDMTSPAIAANSDTNQILIHHNLVYNWNNQTSGADRGLFRNASIGGTLEFNECYSCTTATALIGAVDSTTLTFGNDTGTGAVSATLGTLTISPGTSISQATWGTAGLALVGSAFTANDTTAGSGGVASDVAYNLASPTFTNTQGTANVLTNAVTLRIAPPICGSGWASCTNLYSFNTTGRAALNLGVDIAGASANINANNNFATNINTGTSTATVTVGGGSNAVTLNATTLSLTGTLAGTTISNYLTAPGPLGSVTPSTGAFTTASVTGQFTSTVSTGTAPFVVASTTNVPNLNATLLSGKTHADPGPIGSGTPSTGAFTTLTASSATVTLPGLTATSAAQTGTVCSGAAGILTVDTTTTCLLSSLRWKEHIRPLDVGLDEVLRLTPVSYDLKPEFNPAGLGRQVGLIAEDVQKVDSRLVGVGLDGLANGVRYQQLTALLVRGEQELLSEIHVLEAQNILLRKRVDALEHRGKP